MPIDPVDRELLNRYLSGETGPEESARVEAWLAEEPARWELLATLREELADAALDEVAVEKAKAEVWARLAREVPHAGERPGRLRLSRARVRKFTPVLRRPRFSGAWLAAAIVLLVGGGLGLAALLFRRAPTRPVPMRVATTAPGQRAVFELPDGSRAMLSVASTLRYPLEFGSRSREVMLEGEAYFDVVHDERRPFSVQAGDLVAKDLGTQFTVRSYPEDHGARVVVRRGLVGIRALAPGTPEMTVRPGQLGRLRDGQQPTIEPADTTAWFAWTEGRLVFDETPLREALPQLGRWFNMDFRLADTTLGNVTLTATFRTQPTTDVLNSVAASLGMKLRQAGRTVTLYSGGTDR